MPEIPTFPPQPSRVPKVLGIVILGAASGAVGTLLLFWAYPELRQAQIPPGSQAVIIQQPGTVNVEEGTRIEDIRAQVKPLIGSIFKATDALKIQSDTLYPESKAIGYVVMLSRDGWFGTTASTKITTKEVVVVQGKPYSIGQIITDPSSPYVVGKLTDGSFSVVSFQAELDIHPGMTIAALTSSGSAYRTTLWSNAKPVDAKTFSLSSDRASTAIELADTVAFQPGTPFFSLSGSLIGLTDVGTGKAPTVIPATSLESLLNHVLSSKSASRPLLGVHYIATQSENSNEPKYVIFHENPTLAVEPKSPAAAAKLKAGDTIKSVNGRALDVSLFSILQQYKPGQEVTISYERSGQSLESKIQLGEVK